MILLVKYLVPTLFRQSSGQGVCARSILGFRNRRRYFSYQPSRTMKRKADSSNKELARKTIKVQDYCDVQPKRDQNGNAIWPAPESQMDAARDFLTNWYAQILSISGISILNDNSATSQKRTLIVPDKDADGLSSGVIIHKTLVKLGLDPKLLDVHLVQKGSNIHEDDERRLMSEKSPKFVIVLDQGSRGGPPVIDDPSAQCLLIDHHLSDDFPKDATVGGPFAIFLAH
jgi:hypothetical protein